MRRALVSCPGRVERAHLRERNETRDPGRHDGDFNFPSIVGPGSRCARPGHESGDHDARDIAARAASRWPSPQLTMSNSAVFFVPAARCCARVCPSPRRCLRFHFRRRAHEAWRQRQSRQQQSRPPDEGWMERRQGTLFDFVALARRDLRASRLDLSRSERDLSRRSTVAIFGRGSTPPPPGVKDRSRQRHVREPRARRRDP